MSHPLVGPHPVSKEQFTEKFYLTWRDMGIEGGPTLERLEEDWQEYLRVVEETHKRWEDEHLPERNV